MSAGVAMQKPQHIEDKYVHCLFSWALVWPHQCQRRGLGSSPIFLFPQFPSLSSPCCQCRFWASIQIWFSLSFWVFCWKPRHWASAAAPPSPALPFSGGCHLSVPCCSAGFSLLDKRHSIRARLQTAPLSPGSQAALLVFRPLPWIRGRAAALLNTLPSLLSPAQPQVAFPLTLLPLPPGAAFLCLLPLSHQLHSKCHVKASSCSLALEQSAAAQRKQPLAVTQRGFNNYFSNPPKSKKVGHQKQIRGRPHTHYPYWLVFYQRGNRNKIKKFKI